ncbi:MAG: glutaredoxin family protein [Sandaracinaceae bacterium]
MTYVHPAARSGQPGTAPAVLFRASLAGLVVALAACSSHEDEVPIVPDEGEIVTPPFAVRGEAEGLLLVWFDEEGTHTATSRAEIPEAHREMVRVEDLSIEDDLDPSLVYVADLRRARGDGSYEVRRMARERFDTAALGAPAAEQPAVVATADPTEPIEPIERAVPGAEPADADVIIYGASWCGACRSAAAYLRQRNVPFIERDIEREPGARQAMLEAARRAGLNPSGIPVIEVGSTVIAGFDRGALDRAIAQLGPAPTPI